MAKKTTGGIELNLSQLEAVEHVKGPCMVIAGPGSGKTAVITERLRRLTQDRHIPGSRILVVTFTRDAADEMKKRYLQLTDSKRTDITFGTFHSVFFRMVAEAYDLKENCVADRNEQFRILKDIIIKEKLDAETEPEILEGILSDISKVKTSDLDPKIYRSGNCPREVFQVIFRKYRENLLKRGMIDFDDMLVKALTVLREMPDLCSYWQDKYRYILIDEFQDINLLQYEIISVLGQPENNIFCVGDDDQSIYGFRGAAPDLMKRFLRDNVDCPVKVLNRNYRCGENISAVASKLMNGVPDRMEKDVVSGSGETGRAVIKRYKNREEEYEGLVKNVKDLISAGTEPSEIAVLFRTNNGARGIVNAFYKYNIPFTIDRLPGDIYTTRAGSDVLTFFDIAHGDTSRASYLRVINKPNKMVRRDAFDTEHVDRESFLNRFSALSKQKLTVEKFFRDLDTLRTLAPAEGIAFIRREIGYDRYISDVCGDFGIEKDTFTDVLYDIYADALEHPVYDEWRSSILKRRKDAELFQKDSGVEKGKVRLITMHGSKGLEFDSVFITDCNEGVIPSKKAVTDKEIAEERRLLYVAVTRARRDLNIYCTKERYGKEAKYSRFIGELTKQ